MIRLNPDKIKMTNEIEAIIYPESNYNKAMNRSASKLSDTTQITSDTGWTTKTANSIGTAFKSAITSTGTAPNSKNGEYELASILYGYLDMDWDQALQTAQGGSIQKELGLNYEIGSSLKTTTDTLLNKYFTMKSGEAFSNFLKDPSNDEWLALAESYENKALQHLTASDENGWFTKNFLVPLADVTGSSIDGRGVASAITIAGLLIGGPVVGKVAGGLAAAYSGYKAGKSQAGLDFYDFYKNVKAQGIDVDFSDPKIYSYYLLDACLQGAVEVGDYFVSAGYQTINNALNPAKIGETLGKTFLERGKQFLFNDGVESVLGESFEEFLGGIASDTIMNGVKDHLNEFQGTEFEKKSAKDTIFDAAKAFAQTTVQMLPTVALHLAFNFGLSSARVAKASKNQAIPLNTNAKLGVINSAYIVGNKTVTNQKTTDTTNTTDDTETTKEKTSEPQEKVDTIKVVQTKSGAVPATETDQENFQELINRNGGKNFDVIIEQVDIEEMDSETKSVYLNTLGNIANSDSVAEEEIVVGFTNDGKLIAKDEESKNKVINELRALTTPSESGDYIISPFNNGKATKVQIITQQQAQEQDLRVRALNDTDFLQIQKKDMTRMSASETLQYGETMDAFLLQTAKATGLTVQEVEDLWENDPESLTAKLPNGIDWDSLSISANFMPLASQITGQTVDVLNDKYDFDFSDKNVYVNRNTMKEGVLSDDGKNVTFTDSDGNTQTFSVDDTENVGTAYASMSKNSDGRYTLHINKNARPEDLLEEVMHMTRSMATPEKLSGFKQAYGQEDLWTDDIKKNGDGTFTFNGKTYTNYGDAYNQARVFEERFVDDFMTYLATGETPNVEIKGFFDNLKQFLKKIINLFEDKLSDDTVKAFEKLLSGEVIPIEGQSINEAVAVSEATLMDDLPQTSQWEASNYEDEEGLDESGNPLYSLSGNKLWQTLDANTQRRIDADYDKIYNQYIGTDGWMKAPNGKATNLTERQWVTVRTPAFKSWFGDWENDPDNASKVVDENGEPRVFYHGTRNKFNTFDLNRVGATFEDVDIDYNFFFTASKNIAYGYGKYAMPVFLNIRNPEQVIVKSDSEFDEEGIHETLIETHDFGDSGYNVERAQYNNSNKPDGAIYTMASSGKEYTEALKKAKEKNERYFEKIQGPIDNLKKQLYDISEKTEQFIDVAVDNFIDENNEYYSSKDNIEGFKDSIRNIFYDEETLKSYLSNDDFFNYKTLVEDEENIKKEIDKLNNNISYVDYNDYPVYRNNVADMAMVDSPNQIKSATDNIGTFDANNGSILYSIGYHGTGADFKRFRLGDKVGTGAGSQSFGYGVYIAQSDLIAKGYAKMAQFDNDARKAELDTIAEAIKKTKLNIKDSKTLILNLQDPSSDIYKEKYEAGIRIGKNRIERFDNGGISESSILYPRYKETKEIGAENFAVKDIEDTIKREKERVSDLKRLLASHKEDYKKIESMPPRRRNLYKVTIPDTGYINWYKQISFKDSSKIAKSFNSLYPDKNLSFGTLPTGEYLNHKLIDLLGTPEAASRFLSDVGYVGYKYPAGTIYGLPKGVSKTYNYVIFNPENVYIDDHWQYDTDEEGIGLYSISDREYSGNGWNYALGMSNNAVGAYLSGEKPISKWTSEDLNNIIRNSFDDEEIIAELVKLPKTVKQELLLEQSSWHHTSKFYNKTDFYQPKELSYVNKNQIKNFIRDYNAYTTQVKEYNKKVKDYEKNHDKSTYDISPSGLYKVRQEKKELASEIPSTLKTFIDRINEVGMDRSYSGNVYVRGEKRSFGEPQKDGIYRVRQNVESYPASTEIILEKSKGGKWENVLTYDCPLSFYELLQYSKGAYEGETIYDLIYESPKKPSYNLEEYNDTLNEQGDQLFSLSPERQQEYLKQRHNDIMYAVERDIYVRTEYIEVFRGEEWADKELESRDFMKLNPDIVKIAKEAENFEDFMTKIGAIEKKDLKEELDFDDSKGYPAFWDDIDKPEEKHYENEDLYEKVYYYANVKSSEQRDREFAMEWTASEDKTLELGRTLANYDDVMWKAKPRSKNHGYWYVKNTWGAFKGVSTKVLRLNDGKKKSRVKGFQRSTSEEIKEAQQKILENPRAYRNAYSLVMQAQSRADAVRNGMQNIGEETDWMRMEQTDEIIEADIKKLEEATEKPVKKTADHKKTNKEVEQKLEDAKTDIKKYSNKDDKKTIKILSGDLATAKQELEKAKQDIAKLKEEVSNNEKDMKKADAEYSDLIERMGSEIEANHEKDMDTAERAYSKLIENMGAKIEGLEEKIQREDQNREFLNKYAELKKAQADKLAGTVETQEAKIQREEENRKFLNGYINEKKKQLTTLTLKKDSLERYIDAMKSKIYREHRIEQIRRHATFNNATMDASFEQTMAWVKSMFVMPEERQGITKKIENLNKRIEQLELAGEDATELRQQLLDAKQIRDTSNRLEAPTQLALYLPEGFRIRNDNRQSMWTAEELDVVYGAVRQMDEDARAMLSEKKQRRMNKLNGKVYGVFRQTYGREANKTKKGEYSPFELRSDLKANMPEKQFANGVSEFINKAYLWYGKLQRLARIIDGNKEGIFYDWFVRKAWFCQSSELNGVNERLAKGDAKWKELGFKTGELNKTGFEGQKINGAKYKLSRDQMIGVYIYSQNELGMQKLESELGNSINKDDIKKIIGSLTEREKAWGDFMLQEMDSNWQRLANIYYEVWNSNLGKRKNYFPFVSAVARIAEEVDFLCEETTDKKGKAYVDKSFTKLINPNAIYPLNLNVTATWNRMVRRQEHFIAYGEWSRDSQYMLGKGGLGDIIRQQYGEHMLDDVQRIVDNIISVHNKANDGFSQEINKWLNSKGAAAIIGSVSSTLKQFASAPEILTGDASLSKWLKSGLISRGITLDNFLKANKELLADGYEDVQDFIYSNAPDIKNRKVDFEVLAYLNRTYTGKAQNLVRKGSEWIAKYSTDLVDKMVVERLWLACYYTQYENNIKAGMDQRQAHDEARFKASQFISETQNSNMRMDLSAEQIDAQSNVLLRTLSMFTNQAMNISNQIIYDIPLEVRKGKLLKKGLRIATAVMLSVLMESLISGKFIRRGDEDDDEYIERLMRELLGTAFDTVDPVFLGTISDTMEGYYGSSDSIPVFETLGDILNTLTDVDSDKTAGEKALDIMADIGQEAGEVLGAPLNLVRRPAKAISEENWGHLINSSWAEIIESYR